MLSTLLSQGFYNGVATYLIGKINNNKKSKRIEKFISLLMNRNWMYISWKLHGFSLRYNQEKYIALIPSYNLEI